MSDLMTELEDSLREERLHQFWKQYGNFVIGVVLLTIFATGAVSGYKHWDTSVREADTTVLMDLMESTDFPQNLEADPLDIRPNLRAIALLNGGGSFLTRGEKGRAANLYRRAAEDEDIDPELRQLATLMNIRLELDQPDSNADELIASLKDIANDSASPWRHHAKLDLAAALAHRQNDYAAATAMLDEVLETQGLAPAIYARANDLRHVYNLQAPAPAKKAENAQNGS